MQSYPANLHPAKIHANTIANLIQAKEGALDNCFGFFDGAVRPIIQPGEHQCIVYNGPECVPALTFQSLTLADAVLCVRGPKARLLHHLQLHAVSPPGQPLCICGDPGYPSKSASSRVVQKYYLDTSVAGIQVRIAVEWCLGNIANDFK